MSYAFDNCGDTQKHKNKRIILKGHDGWKGQNSTEDDTFKTESFPCSHGAAERNNMHQPPGWEMDGSGEKTKTYEIENEATCGTLRKRKRVAR